VHGSYLRVRVKDGEQEWQPFGVEEQGRSYHKPSGQDGVKESNDREPEQEQEEQEEQAAGTPTM